MTTATSTPADPESAALDLLVRIGEAVPGAGALRAALQNFAGVLQIEGALAGLTAMAELGSPPRRSRRLPARRILSPRFGFEPPRCVPAAGTTSVASTLKASPRRSTPLRPCWP
jgi:hypothetical protein